MLEAVKRFLRRNKGANDSCIGVELTPGGICVARVEARSNGDVELDTLVFAACEPDEWPQTLGAMVEQHRLRGSLCELVFHPKFYNLMLLDAPAMDDAELAEAVKWRVKDLISQDIEDVVVDAFNLPPDAYRGRMNMIYAAIIDRETIAKSVAMVEPLDLALQRIGVSELCLTNLVRCIEGLENQGIALVKLEGAGGYIDIVENGALYLTRNLDTGLDALSESLAESDNELTLDIGRPVDSLALDIQRSLDYYESQIGKSSITRIYVLAHHSDLAKIAEQLGEVLPVMVEPFNFFQWLDCHEQHVSLLGHCSVAIAAAVGGVFGKGLLEERLSGEGGDAVSTRN